MIYIAIITLIIFGVLFLLLLSVRSLRWMGIIQQKEYRLDRLQSYLRSEDGNEEITRIFPKLEEFSRTGLKRPKITARLVVLAFIYAIVLVALLYLVISLWLLQPITLAFWLMAIYLSVPVLVALAALLTSLIAKFQILRTLKKATQLINQTEPRIIGIGGSYGKTSTKLILSELLSQKFSVFKTPKSFNNAYSIASSIATGYQGEEIAVIEYGAYRKGEIDGLTRRLPPEMAVITGLTEQHLSLFGSMESSVLAESELVSSLTEGSHVFLNAADKGVKHIVTIGSQGKRLKKHLYGLRSRVKEPKLDDHGMLSFLYDRKRIQTNLVGLHYLENIEGALMVAEHLGVTTADIISGLRNFDPKSNFVRSYRHRRGAWVLDDSGTSNPEGFRAMLKLAATFKEKQKILVFPGIVDLGEKSEEIHQDLAWRSAKIFDRVLYVGHDGLDQFSQELGEKLISDKSEILTSLAMVTEDNLIAEEGRMPGWLEEAL